MRGDFSAWNKDRSQNFRGTLHQQGRVLTDRDWNSQAEITGEWQETAARDAFGAGIAAVPADSPNGFKVVGASLAAGVFTVSLLRGRVWADGLLAELFPDTDPAPPAGVDAVRTATYLGLPIQAVPAAPVAGDRDAVILETWLEELNAFQKPDLLLEPALGGVDTTERIQTATRIRLYRMAAGDTCDSIIPKLKDDFSQKGKLTVKPDAPAATDGDCPVVTGGGYTGFEHRLYRIEIAETKASIATKWFKWSQMNGGLVGRGAFDGAANKVTITANKNAIIYSGLNNFYLEALVYDKQLGCWKVVYGAKAQLAADNTITLPAAASADIFLGTTPTSAAGTDMFFRLWNGIAEVSTVEANIPDNNGLKMKFDTADATKYRAGDYWTFEARAAGLPNPPVIVDNRPPEGIFYHRVPLAELNWTGASTVTGDDIEDCRRPFQPLTKLKTCCTYRVGDGVHSFGDFTSINAAINALPKKGGEVCILPGIYVENVVVKPPHNRNIILKGCGRRTVIRAKDYKDYGTDPELCAAIYVKYGQNVTIESLAVEAHHDGFGIFMEGIPMEAQGKNKNEYLTDITLSGLFVTATQKTGIRAHTVQNLTLSRSAVYIIEDEFSLYPAVYLSGDDMLIERTEIRVLPDFTKKAGLGPLDTAIGMTETIGELLDEINRLSGSTNQFLSLDPDNFVAAVEAPGGLQIAGGSERVRIINNLIVGGRGNGISLGNVDLEKDGEIITNNDPVTHQDPDDCCKPGDDHNGGGDVTVDGYTPVAGPPLDDILIKFNRIYNMGRNGIGNAATFSLSEDIDLEGDEVPTDPAAAGMIFVSRLVISENRIERCMRLSPGDIEGADIIVRGFGGIALAIVEHLVIRDNFIIDNCEDMRNPICGIFVFIAIDAEITQNKITEHLPQDYDLTAAEVKPGPRGGIWIFISLGYMDVFNYMLEKFPEFKPFFEAFSDAAALTVQENVVSTPLGRCLTTMTVGDAQINDNRFTSFGLPPFDLASMFRMIVAGQADYAAIVIQLLNLVATNVLIFDLGTLVMMKGIAAIAGGTKMGGTKTEEAENKWGRAQTDLAKAKADYEANPNDANKMKYSDAQQAEAQAHKEFDDARAAAAAAGPAGNAASYSAYQPGMQDRLGQNVTKADGVIEVFTKGGMIEFADNQCKFNPRGKEPNFAMTSVLIAGLPDLGFNSNQVSCDMPRTMMPYNTFLFACTVRATSNYFRENIDRVLYSAATRGFFLNNTSDNESVHCLLVKGKQFLKRYNLVMRALGATPAVSGDIMTVINPTTGETMADRLESFCEDGEREQAFWKQMMALAFSGQDMKLYENYMAANRHDTSPSATDVLNDIR